ncbi:MAG TPA: AraC family transcriptional regulator [Puia sp.]|nr:AraC family transcriptional regulator [Puia sp.]
MVNNSTDIIPGSIVYSWITEKEREKDGFLSESVLALQISGQLTLETSSQKISTKRGDVLLMRKHQFVKMTKTPLPGEDYKIIFILLSQDIIKKYALENQVEVREKYKGKPNVFIPKNEFIQGFFQSLIPYMDKPQTVITNKLGMLKVKEAVELLLYATPGLNAFLFDFSEPHKIDLEKFMLGNFHFNVPVEKFAQLTGRSLAGFKRDFQKTFGTSPRQWLQDKRLTEARYQIEKKSKKPSAIYSDLGFESLSHFSNSFKQKFGIAPTELL